MMMMNESLKRMNQYYTFEMHKHGAGTGIQHCLGAISEE